MLWTNAAPSLALHHFIDKRPASNNNIPMKVTEHIAQAKDTLISFEVLPPLKGKGIDALYKHLDPLMEYKPSYINVTYHRSEHQFKKRADGSFEKVVIRKRPGTESICA